MPGAYIKENAMELLGRRRIYTDVDEITPENIFRVLGDAAAIHEMNANEILYLLRFEKGIQPLPRKKQKRPDIDIRVADNIANQIVEFKLSYNYGNPITYVQRGNKDIANNPPAKDDDAITQLNEMNDSEAAYAKDIETARYFEICGIAYQMVDIKREYDGASVFNLYSLHPLYTFLIYKNDVAETPIMGVTFRQLESGDRYYSCYTKDAWYEVKNLVEIVDGKSESSWQINPQFSKGARNPLGMIPIVEFLRDYDRMGCFERQVGDIGALNTEVSDFANAVAQSCQEIWWGNDFEFPKDESGQLVTPKSNEWVLTKTLANGKTPLIKALSSTFDFGNVQKNIESKRNIILQKCYVPLQSDPNSGATGSAMSLSSGWAAAENAAMKEEQIIRRSKAQVLALELAAIRERSHWLNDSPIVDLKLSDIYIKFTRQKTYDLGTKTNAMVAMIKTGINGRVAMQTVDLFSDVAQAWNDSKEMIEKLQESLVEKEKPEDSEKKVLSDSTDQAGQSPILDGMNNTDYAPDEIDGDKNGA